MKEKIERLLKRFQEVEEEMGSSALMSNPAHYRELAQEHARLSEVCDLWVLIQGMEKELLENEDLFVSEKDPQMQAMLKEEIEHLQTSIEKKGQELQLLLVPPDPKDHRPILLELRAGTGGDEASLFVGDCVRMYQYYAETKKWKCEILAASESEAGGLKECILSLTGKNVHRFMQFEAGTHRVQRVPKTEAQGRVHTSAVTVAVLLEPGEEEKIVIDDRDLQIDTYRASGAGGQHVNRTDSAVRITHLPTGTVVTCQEERSQHKNKEKAMRVLSTRIAEEVRKKAEKEMTDIRSSQIGTGDRSERIRTYNFPQNRITDHRIDLTIYKLDRVMEGDLDPLVLPLVNHLMQQKLR